MTAVGRKGETENNIRMALQKRGELSARKIIEADFAAAPNTLRARPSSRRATIARGQRSAVSGLTA